MDAAVRITIAPELVGLLERRYAGKGEIVWPVARRASIKDILESFGIPHTEIGCIMAGGQERDFNFLPVGGERVQVFSKAAPVNVLQPSVLRPRPLADLCFAVDVNVGRLARYLRLAGFDVYYENPVADEALAEIAASQGRLLLSKDKGLLKRRAVEHGHLVRAVRPEEQFREVVNLFGLAQKFAPFRRCLDCNALLEPVKKEEVVNLLEPLTKKYYQIFSRCPRCRKVYWPGSHRRRMLQLINTVKLD